VTITYHKDLFQGSDEWHAQRCGMLTASEMHLILTPTLKMASNEKERQHLYALLSQRITKYVEPQYISDAMLRGETEERLARELYSEKYAPVVECGFVTNDVLGFNIGYSPDGLVGDDGLIEVKSRGYKYQVQTIIEGVMPSEFMLQVQTGLLVTQRQWCDFISYAGGLPMFWKRIYPDLEIQTAIKTAAIAFEQRLGDNLKIYQATASKFFDTERTIEEMVI
jgi:hypothetical protein